MKQILWEETCPSVSQEMVDISLLCNMAGGGGEGLFSISGLQVGSV